MTPEQYGAIFCALLIAEGHFAGSASDPLHSEMWRARAAEDLKRIRAAQATLEATLTAIDLIDAKIERRAA